MTQSAQVLEAAFDAGWELRRVGLTLLTGGLIVACLGLMRWGWVRRAERQSDVSPLPPVPAIPGADDGDNGDEGRAVRADGRYLGATRSGDWLDRVVVHGLGVPSKAHLVVSDAGMWIVREGAPDIFVTAGSVTCVRHDRAGAGRVYEADGVLVVAWNHDGTPIDLALRVPDAMAADSVRSAIELASNSSSTTIPGDSA